MKDSCSDIMSKSEIIIDVRSREEFVREHIKGAFNIPHYDLIFHEEFLKDKDVKLACNTMHRSRIGQQRLEDMGIESQVLTLEEQNSYETDGRPIICALNFISLRPGEEGDFMSQAMQLCRATESMDGFLGSKVLRVDGMSAIGSFLPGDLTDMKIEPLKYILVTFWESKEAHEVSHALPEFKEIFDKLGRHLATMPIEEFYEILK